MLQLQNVQNWTTEMTCTPTALCAVTGKLYGEVRAALDRAVQRAGRPPIGDYPAGVHPDHWKAAMADLGYALTEIRNYRQINQQGRPRLSQVINPSAFTGHPLILIVCNDQSGEKGHVLAAQGALFVDIPTKGQIEQFKVYSDYVSHRADYVLEVSHKKI